PPPPPTPATVVMGAGWLVGLVLAAAAWIVVVFVLNVCLYAFDTSQSSPPSIRLWRYTYLQGWHGALTIGLIAGILALALLLACRECRGAGLRGVFAWSAAAIAVGIALFVVIARPQVIW